MPKMRINPNRLSILCDYMQVVIGSQSEGSEHLSKMSSGADVFYPVVKKSPLAVSKKIYEFYTAPITKFWMHTVNQLIFIVA